MIVIMPCNVSDVLYVFKVSFIFLMYVTSVFHIPDIGGVHSINNPILVYMCAFFGAIIVY